jgi:hypothetical protein
MAMQAADLRCSTQARGLGLDPAGTAVSMPAVLLVEVPLPWPDDIGELPAIAALAGQAAALGARVQAVVPDPGRRASGEARIVLHRRPPGPFRGYDRHVVTVPADALADGVRAVAASSTTSPGTDVLVCSHGARDRCCGSLGTALAATMPPRRGVDVVRTSHLGGHRFAPTVLVLPSGTAWAWMDEDLLTAVVDRSVAPSELRPHYRGSTAMAHPALQVVEAEMLARVGWEWLDHARDGTVEDLGDGHWRARIESTAGTWTGTVEEGGTTPQPPCGAPLALANKEDRRWHLADLHGP